MPPGIHGHRLLPRSRAGRDVLVYGVLGSLWILGSEWLLADSQAVEVTRIQVAKGLTFVAVSAVLFFGLMLRNERRMRAEAAPVALVLRQVPGLAWTTDAELRVTTVAGSGLGAPFSADDPLGRPVWEVATSQERREAIERAHRRALQGEGTDLRVDFGANTYLSRIEPLVGEGGRIFGCVGIALDFTGSPVLDGPQGVRQALLQSQSMAALGSLVLAVAHQLKNPLFAMSAALDAFEQRTGDEPATARHRAILREQAERIRLLVNALQEYGQIREPTRVSAAVAPILVRVAADWQGRATRAGLDFRLEGPEPEAEARIDSEAVSRALHCLLENAVMHSPEGGRVVLAGRALPDGVEVVVEDSGPGFREADLGQVLRPLFSRHPARPGLGLAVVDRVVQLHGGRVELDRSTLGGARVRIVLPR